MSVTITACANSTIPDGTVFATCSIGGVNYEAILLADTNGSILGIPANPFSASISNTACVIVNSGSMVVTAGSVVVTNALSASISNVVTVAQGASGASPWGMRILDAAGNAFGYGAASPLYVAASAVITNSPSVIVSSGSAVITAGSVIITNSPSVSVTNLAGSAAGSPLFTSITNLAGSAAGSPLFTSTCITNWAGSAAGSPLFTSITNLAGSAAGSPLFASITNSVSASISNTLTASAIQGAAAAITAPWPVKLSDSVDSAAVDSASRIFVSITDGTQSYGLPASPLSQTGQGQTMYWAGSLLTIKQANLSASISGCTLVVASTSGAATVILNATFTTSTSQFIGWVASGAGGASALVQTAMPFGTNGGMDAKRSPDSYLWLFPSGSNAIITTTSACNVAGTINYINVAS